MHFTLKILAVAAIAAMASMASITATATPVTSLAGPHNWKFQGTTSDYSPAISGGRGNENTWGIGEITEIRKANGDAAYSAGDAGVFLYYILYGIADLSITPGSPAAFNLYNVGCTGGACDGKIHLDIYGMPTSISGILAKDPDDRTSFGTFNGLTNVAGASLYLALELVRGKVIVDDLSTPTVDERNSTLFQNVNAGTLPTTGSGTFFADAVGGSGKAQWDTNGFLLSTGAFADFDGNFTLKPNFASTGGACPDSSTANTCFLGLINDPVQSNAVPEPGSLALLGLALAGLGVSSRRKQK